MGWQDVTPSGAGRAALAAHPDLEALPATVDDGVNANSDKINS